MTILIQQHKSSSYAPRTYHNAASAEITLAIAADFTTAGEKLTKKAAGDKFINFDITEDPIHCARKLYQFMKQRNATTLNIAGNGIYTFNKFGYTQEYCNEYLLEVLSPIHEFIGITKIVSGVQTGMDLAAGVVAKVLDIEFIGTLPNGFKQRHEDGIDVCHTMEEVVCQIDYYAKILGGE